MRIALIYPATDFDRRHHPDALPNGILYLAALVERRRGDTVDVFDARHGPPFPDRAQLRRYNLIGFTAMTTQISNALKLARRICDGGFRGPIVFGGPHATVAADHLRNVSFASAIFIGEAEETFLHYLDYLEGKPHRLERVWVRDSRGQWQFHPGESFVENLDSLPFPAREKYGDLAARVRFINVTTTRGCPYQCNYCQPTKQLLFGKRVRRRSVSNIVAELEDAVARFAINSFSIDDDTFTFHEPTVVEFCRRIAPLRLRWSCQSRTDIRRPTLEAMRDSGCDMLFVGAESGSQRILERMDKKNTVEANAEFLRACHALGIRTWCNMMVGYPGETRDDMELSLDFVLQTRPTRVCVTQVTPFPGTYLWERNHADVIAQDWSAFARHVFRPKFKTMARLQPLINYYKTLMSKEWEKHFGADMVGHSGALVRWIARRPAMLSLMVRCAPWLFRWLTRRGRNYLDALDKAVEAARSARLEEGIRLLEELKRRYPTETDPAGHLGWIYLTTGRPDKAVENYTYLLALDPGNLEARALLTKAREAARNGHPAHTNGAPTTS